MHDILLPKGMYSQSRDLFKFWEVSDNTSETVQDRDMVAMEDYDTIRYGRFTCAQKLTKLPA